MTAHLESELVLVRAIDIVRPAALHPISIYCLIDIPRDKVGEGLLGVAVHRPEVQHHCACTKRVLRLTCVVQSRAPSQSSQNSQIF